MRFSSTLLLALPALALAEEQQIPLGEKVKGWWSKVTSAVPVPAAASSPIAATAAKVAQSVQHQLTPENWKDVLTHDPTVSAPTTQEWMVFITGGNSTCYGLCGNASKAWNVRKREVSISHTACMQLSALHFGSPCCDNTMYGIMLILFFFSCFCRNPSLSSQQPPTARNSLSWTAKNILCCATRGP